MPMLDGPMLVKAATSMEFSLDIPTDILSEKPTSFFRDLQSQIDQDDPQKRCQRYGYQYQYHPSAKSRRRRLFLGSLIAEEPLELLQIVAAESYGIYAGMVFVESNRTQNFDPRPVRRANDQNHIQQLQTLFGTPQLQIRLYTNEKPRFTGIRREHAQRQEILRGWKEMGMTPFDVGIIADADETFTRDFLRAAQECDIPHLDYAQHQCFTSNVKLAASSLVFETSPECVTAQRGWYHPEMILGACIEMIGNRSVHPLAFRDGPRRAHGYGRACSKDFSKLVPGRHPLWNAADFRMLCGRQAYGGGNDNGHHHHHSSRSNYTGFHFHNWFTSFNATRLKYKTYGHAMKARKAFTWPLYQIGKNDLKLMYHCVRNMPDEKEQKWKRVLGGFQNILPPIPIYFADTQYLWKRHEWIKKQVQMDDEMVEKLQQSAPT